MRRARFGSYLLLTAVLTGFAVFLLYPIWLTVSVGFEARDGGFTFYHVLEVLRDPSTRIGLLNALGIAVCTTIASIAISIPLALVSVKCDFPGKTAFNALVLVPLILPPFVGAIGLHHLLGRHGAISELLISLGLTDHGVDFIGQGGFWAIVLIESLHLYPIIYLNAAAALANLDPALEEAASGLGASASRRLRQIVLPLIRPGLFAGGTIVFIWSFTELGTPLMFDYHQVTPVQIFNGNKEMQGSTRPYPLTAVLLIVAAGTYLIRKVFLGGRSSTMYSKASIRSVPRKLGPIGSAAALLLFGGVTLAAVMPHISVVLASLTVEGGWYDSVLPTQWTMHNYDTALGHSLASGSIRNSLLYSSLAVGIDLIVGLAIGYLIVRVKVRGRGLVDALAMLPLAVPGLVMAFGYVAMTLRWPFGKDDPLEGVISVVGADPNPVLLL